MPMQAEVPRPVAFPCTFIAHSSVLVASHSFSRRVPTLSSPFPIVAMGTSRVPSNTSSPYGPPGAVNLVPYAGAPVADPPAVATADLTAALMSTAGFAASRLCVPPCSSVPPSVATVGSPAVIAEAANDEWVVVIQIVYAFRHATVAVLVQEALQCLLWGSDSDVQVAYELRTLDQLEQQREQQLQNQEQQQQGKQNQLPQQAMLQALDAGAVEVRVLFENRGGTAPLNGDDSSSSSCIRRKEKGRVLAWSLDDLAAAADLVVPAASRMPDGAFAVRTAAAALEHQKQQPLQQNLLLLQRSRAALPLRKGALWSFLLSAETAAKLRHKAGEDVLPLAVQAVKVYMHSSTQIGCLYCHLRVVVCSPLVLLYLNPSHWSP